MLYCEKCGVKILTELKKCPLCQNDLEGDNSGCRDCFPRIKEKPPVEKGIIKLTAFGLTAISIIAVIINFCVPSGGWWSLFVVAGALTAGLTFAMVLKKRGNILKTIAWQTFITPALAFAWDYFTGYRGWSVDYVLPIVCCCAMIAMAVLAIVMKLKPHEYIIYFIIDSIFCVFPLILILCDKVKVILPSFICIAASFISLAALITLYAKPMKEEIIRRTHL